VLQAGSIGAARDVDRSALYRLYPAFPPKPRNDNNVGAGRCPVCNGRSSITGTTSEHHGKGVVHHHWRCHSCGHEWVTVLHVSV